MASFDHNLAEIFDKDKAYPSGQILINEGKLYFAKEDITGGHYFNPEKFQQIYLADLLRGHLNSNLATYESGSLSVPKSFSSLSAYVGKNGKLIIVQGTAYKYTDIVYLYDFVNHKKGYLIYKNVNISTYACECFDISAISYNPSTGILSQDIYDEYNTWYGFVGNFYCIK